MANYIARLQTSGLLARLCPNGLGEEIAADVWLQAGDDAKALNAATRTGKPLVLGKTRLAIVDRCLEPCDMANTIRGGVISLTPSSLRR